MGASDHEGVGVGGGVIVRVPVLTSVDVAVGGFESESVAVLV